MTTPVYVDTMMRGNQYVRETVGNYLQAKLPTYIDTLRSQNPELTEYTLPYPKQYLSSDPYDTSQQTYPIIGTYFTGTDNFNRASSPIQSGSHPYEVTYESVIFVSVITPYIGQEEGTNFPKYQEPYRASTIQLRDNLTACVRASILGSPSFGTARQNNRIVADLTTMRETYPEPMKMSNDGSPLWICSGLINLNISATELVASPVYGQLQEVVLGMDLLPFE